MGDADPPDAPGLALGLEPRQVLRPGDEVVHLLDVDAAEPGELSVELEARLGRGGRPDLRQHLRVPTPAVERGPEGALGSAVHRRRVERADAGGERGSDGPLGLRLVAG